MLRPFYQYRLFWLGVPGLAFLLWCWWDSTENCSAVLWARSHSMVGLYLFDSRICLVLTEDTPEVPAVLPVPAIQFHRGTNHLLSRGGRLGSPFSDDSGVKRAELPARHYFAPGMYRLRWSFPFSPHPAGPLPGLPYREWGFSMGWVTGSYVMLLTFALAAWQRRKRRLLMLETAVP